MRRKICQSVALIAVASSAVLATPSARAQSGFGTKPTAGIFGGVTFPRGAFADEIGTGWNAGGFAKIRAYGPLDVRIDGTYNKFAEKDLVETGGTVTTKAAITFGTIGALINLGTDSAAYPGDNSVSPYLMAGAGRYRLDYDAVCVGTSCDQFIDPGVHTFWGTNIGGGATIPLAGIRTFLEARYHRISRSDPDGGARSMVVISAGVKFR
ncbi:MAG: outer membrane beta-barrel protein [Gemmatimonadales bacterium]